MICLLTFLRSIQPLSIGFERTLKAVIRMKALKRREYLEKSGQICRNIYFVEKGLLRCDYTIGNKTVSHSFRKENEICASWASYFSQQPGIINIQALEKCILHYIDFEDFYMLTKKFPEFNIICWTLLGKCLRTTDQRLMKMWMQPAYNRFQWLMSESPDLLERVSGKDLGSYLGIGPVMFSRLKSRVSKQIDKVEK
jgi:CRP/FNR family transcriptional regulator, anaerobic regulatory protein